MHSLLEQHNFPNERILYSEHKLAPRKYLNGGGQGGGRIGAGVGKKREETERDAEVM